jgi:hypothetical protein
MSAPPRLWGPLLLSQVECTLSVAVCLAERAADQLHFTSEDNSGLMQDLQVQHLVRRRETLASCPTELSLVVAAARLGRSVVRRA